MSSPESRSGQPLFVSAEALAANFRVATEEQVAVIQGKIAPEVKNREMTEMRVSVERAKEILGADFLGIEAVGKTFDVTFDTEAIPPIPFSEADIEKARELGQFLILRIGKIPGGRPITMEAMNTVFMSKHTGKNTGKLSCDTDRYGNQEFYKEDRPTHGWALVTKDTIPNTCSKNYFQQTEDLFIYINTTVLKEMSVVPPEYQEALAEFQEYCMSHFPGKSDTEIEALLGKNMHKN